MSIYGKIIIFLISCVVVLFILTRIGIFSGKRPENIGVKNGQLYSCPETPNCVCTFAEDTEHSIRPLPSSGSLQQDQERILDVVRSFAGTRIVVVEADYIHVEFQTAIMKYTDDVEFLINEKDGHIHFRSASRLGIYDLGLNRRRMEQFRLIYMQNQ